VGGGIVMEMNTKFGNIPVNKEGDKFELPVPHDSELSKALKKFDAKMWLEFLEKCRAAGIQAEEIVAITNKDNNMVVLTSNNEKSLESLMNCVADTANSNGATIVTPVQPSAKQPHEVEVNPQAIEDIEKRLGI
jgi:hypothetical protein